MRGFGLYIVIIGLLAACKQDKPAPTMTNSGSNVLDDLTTLIKKNPEDPTLLSNRAKVYIENGDYDSAIQDLQGSLEIDSMRIESYHLLSDCYMDYFRSKDALQTMEKAAELFPERIPTLLKLSETQLILKKNHASLLTIAQINTLDQNNAEAFFMTGMNFRALGETERAIKAFLKATDINPELVDAWLITGDLYDEMGNPIALDYYDAAINVDPNEPTAWHSKAFYLQNNNRESEAIQLYKKINVIDRNYIDAYLNAGILYMTMDSLDKAEEQFVIMSNVEPQNHLPYYYRGLIKGSQNDVNSARELLETCLQLNPDHVKAKKALDDLATS